MSAFIPRTARSFLYTLILLGIMLVTNPIFSQHFTELRSFGFPDQRGYMPWHRLLEASNGVLYGVTDRGGRYNNGTIFKVNKDGSGFATLKHFRGDGYEPYA